MEQQHNFTKEYPKITTVIPTYRRPKLLKRALESVLNQSYGGFQVCVYDNASGDETENVVRIYSLKDDRVKYHCHERNIGPHSNINYGLSKIDTDFFNILCDDDLLLPGFFSYSIKSLEENNEAFFFVGTTVMADMRGNILGAPMLNWEERLYYPPEGGITMLQKGHPEWNGILFRKEILGYVSSLDPETGAASDLDFEIKLGLKYPFIVSRKPCAVFVSHPESVTTKFRLDNTWPGWLKMINNVNEISDLPGQIKIEIGDILLKRMQSRIFIAGIKGLLIECKSDVINAANVLESRFYEFLRPRFLRIMLKDSFCVLILRNILKGVHVGICSIRKKSTHAYWKQVFKKDINQWKGIQKKIVIFQTWGIGDMVMSTPMLAALKECLPGSDVTVVVGSKEAADVIEGSRLCDEVTIIPFRAVRVINVFREMLDLKKRNFDAAIICTRISPFLAVILRIINFSKIIAGDFGGKISGYTHSVKIEKSRHRVESNLEILRMLLPGAMVKKTYFHLDENSIMNADKVFLGLGVGSGPFIGIHPGPKGGESVCKAIPEDMVIKIAKNFLSMSPERRVFIFLGPKEYKLAENFKHLDSRIIVMNDLKLRTAAAVISKMDVFVSGDTGLGHIAAALNVPVITLAGPTEISSTKPWGEKCRVIEVDSKMPCKPCYGSRNYRNCLCDRECMSRIPIDDVGLSIEESLKG